MVSDEDFIKAWAEHKSPAKVAEALSLNLRNVYARRRALESRYGLNLNAQLHDDQIVVQRHSARVDQQFSSGIGLVFSDAHFWPKDYTTAFRALLNFCGWFGKDVKFVCCNGDAFDGASISRHMPIGHQDLPTVRQELDAVDEHLTMIEDAAPRSNLVWSLGNHDMRYETRLATNAPEYRGVDRFSLKDHFPKWKPCWSFWANDTVCKHRFKGGIHAAFNNTVWSGMNIITSHDHMLWVRPFRDYNGVRYGADTGTLSAIEAGQFRDYTEDNPLNWQSGFLVLTWSNGRLLHPEPVIVTGENRVEFRGQEIEVD